MATEQEVQVLAGEVEGLRVDLAALLRRLDAAPGTRCRAAMPHNTLRWNAGERTYFCECGQVYEKTGRGGLREVA